MPLIRSGNVDTVPPFGMITCPDCKKFVSKKASSCPNCGRAVQGAVPKIVLKVVLWLFVVGLICWALLFLFRG